MRQKKFKLQRGQALVTLLFFMIIAITVTSAAVVIIFNNSVSAQKLEEGTLTYYIAQSGAENAILRLLRNPNYCGETLPIDTGTAAITVVDGAGGCNGISPITVTSTGTSGDFQRKIQVVATYVSNVLTVTSWKEIYL
ncbi:MAG: hypothetical protein ACD_50C00205G0002 [uncultured bacterium]|nr:MAG: hypothetical protein ACD_50C00205G0002 [uncultured bacterium]OGH13116.1 MAG: hypothetical protein A2687_00455 [Candidatus Levybacteria bacterium RIFCSPHIGHO2_01_FULL_38_26]